MYVKFIKSYDETVEETIWLPYRKIYRVTGWPRKLATIKNNYQIVLKPQVRLAFS